MKQEKKLTRREALQLALSYKQDLESKMLENHAHVLSLRHTEEFIMANFSEEVLEQYKLYLNQRLMESIAAGSVGREVNQEIIETAVGKETEAQGVNELVDALHTQQQQE
ncbi:hypothetical protein NVP2117O_18 [Vibrio phage 2.117.O._10N.261.45.E9]|nr:hypothetical protein NVP1117O_18 [Vibrio phage 1.117.O._10N.261.45.E9]AUR95419.1 hypothetical protein NVP1207B_12 [Vibrio phage 1.207.B._10N.222.51.C2]AUS02310.1 hypothetical protein NVP2117O_18 [Vibrio phage 2.117.O._10N.261.45.E9]